MTRKPKIERTADNILERGVVGPSVTPNIPYDDGGSPYPSEADPEPTVPQDVDDKSDAIP